ncbi:class II aldolase/adducin family protein [Pontibacillus yanchengensis]|uniref:Class II aldolase/adducin family protein n=2 Tax=Pontibacillus yanchengensis TaxID=462910 RepID=A0ACC7VGP4_9BACI|nr:class II aldolase/adducin family protein [Pontibacillus yanchengensis]MYL32513.1 class II aldolase/adducin family protein [Pontibacillus yanchengensis]MYL53094.1 class II aldolase/adducin family protein [Pontibacillus yanchengensis]
MMYDGTFHSVEEERQFVKQRLAASFRLFSKFGFNDGSAGHITVRDPENKHHFWVNPFMVHFGQVKASELLLIDEDGNVLKGEYGNGINGAAIAIHSAIHKARPDVNAAAHAHSPYGMAWSTLGRTLDPITQDACTFYNDHSIFNDYTGVVYDDSEGDRIARALDSNKAVILQNHGLLTTGQSVDEAAWWFIAMERACQVQMTVESTGSKPILIDAEHAIHTQKQMGLPEIGREEFKPLYDMITKEHPDLVK